MFPSTFSMQWHITNGCDQRCKHCYIFNSGSTPNIQKWDLNDAIKLLDDYLDFCKKYQKNPNIALTGGDPILHPNFWDIIQEIKGRNIPFVILGNPFHIDAKEADVLTNSGCWCYQVSIDGLRKTHDAMRKPGSFDATINWLKKARYWNLRTSVMTTVSSINYKQVPEIARIVTEIGVDVYSFARYCPTHNDTEFNLSPSEYHSFLEKMWDFYQENAEKGTTFAFKDHLWKALMMEKGILTISDDDIIYDGCHCGFTHLTFLENGDAYACRRMNSKIGHFPENNIEEIFFGKEMQKYREIERIEECSDCKLLRYCRGCRAVAYGTTGNFLAKDPQCWFHKKPIDNGRAH